MEPLKGVEGIAAKVGAPEMETLQKTIIEVSRRTKPIVVDADNLILGLIGVLTEEAPHD